MKMIVAIIKPSRLDAVLEPTKAAVLSIHAARKPSRGQAAQLLIELGAKIQQPVE